MTLLVRFMNFLNFRLTTTGTKEILSLLKALESILHAVLLPTAEEDFIGEEGADAQQPQQGMSRLFQDLVMQPFSPIGAGYATAYASPEGIPSY